ncbi:hydantoinase/oxoprolinase family protein [Xanthobacter autotrophicus DSM 431]|uniref:hydantoinase/oxoprolinase family protein n=1 Tax=Xanthobacter nonsaccharivorans TaxID=3119912 RepID=UPI00372B4E17
MTYHIGVDIGGTFTDTICIDSENGEVRLSKVPSTPENQATGFLNGLSATQIAFPAISWLVHGTTVGTNATLERNGADCGLITTRGFRDILELGRRERPQLYGLFGEFEPLIPRDRRIEIGGRMNARGEIVEDMDDREVEEAIRALQARGCESLLIGFLHSYANPVHEERAAAIAARLWHNPYITTSSDILGEFREVERFGTAAVNAYIQPKIHRYVSRLRDSLREAGVPRDLVIMQANGGIMSVDAACRRSVSTVLSGPAAGVIAASYISDLAGYKNVITCDMGGTSFDVGMIVKGEPIVTSDRDLGFGLPMRIPIIDIHTIGAGGGSIARIDEAGLLKVGPASAGATPGPIAYGRGGTRPTVTDANVMLGRLSSERLLAVNAAIDREKIEAAFRDEIGAPLGLAPTQAAAAVLRIVNDAMAGAIRAVSVQRGLDPREFAIFAFGGAGPLHGVALARELGVPKVIVPYVPGITCALGCIVADVRHDFVQTVSRAVADLSEHEIAEILARHRRAGEDTLRRDEVPVERTEVHHFADMQYEGQTYTVRVPLDPAALDVANLHDRLAKAYQDRFGITLTQFRPKLTNLRTTVIGIRPSLDLKRIVAATQRQASAEHAVIGHRDVWFDDNWVNTPIYDRTKLPIGTRIAGPGIFNQMDTTTVVEPNTDIMVDDFGNLIIEVK